MQQGTGEQQNSGDEHFAAWVQEKDNKIQEPRAGKWGGNDATGGKRLSV